MRLWIKKLEFEISISVDPEKTRLTNKLDKIEKAKKKFNKFVDDILQLRNYLAHAKPVSGEKNTLKVWVKEDDCYYHLTLDLDVCKEIRKKFHDYEKNIIEITNLISSST